MNRPSFTALSLRASLALLLAVTGAGAWSHGFQAGALKIDHPWARVTVPGQQAGGAFLSVQNTGGAADRLLGGSSPAGHVELHTMAMDGNVMRMREVPAIDLPAGETVDLQPATTHHLMITGLKAPLKQGDSVPLTLRFEKAGEVQVTLKVQAARSADQRPPMENASGASGQHQH